MAVALIPAFAVEFAAIFFIDGVRFDALWLSFILAYWATIAIVFVVITSLVFGRADGATLARWLRETSPGSGRARLWYLVNGGGAASWAVTGSVVAVGAVVVLSVDATFRSDPLLVWTSVGAVIGALALTITAYAVRYARFYAQSGGLTFPGGAEPRFSDFVYLAVQIATTFSTSDVAITNPRLRRTVTTNSLISFAFNTVVVALLVSVLISTAA